MESLRRTALTVAIAVIAVVGTTSAVAVGGLAAVGVASADEQPQAASTDVVLEPQNPSVTAGDSITFDIVVTNADNGVGGYEPINVTVGDTETAQITDINAQTGGATQSTVSDDGSQASVQVDFGGDTEDTGNVTIATVTVATESPGDVDVGLNFDGDITDEQGMLYTVGDVRGSSLSVEPAGPETGVELAPSSQSVTEGDSVTYEILLTNASSGVGSYENISVSIGNASTAKIVDITDETGGESQASVAADGTEATVGVTSGGNTTDSGEVTLATVAVSGVAAGQANIAVDLTGGVANEGGDLYDVTTVTGGSVDVVSADAKTVELRPSNEMLSTGDSTTLDIVITNVTDGVGAFDNISVTSSNASAVELTDASLGDGLGTGSVAVVDDGEKAYMNVPFGGDTADEGDIILGTVSVEAMSAGEVTLNLNVTGDISAESGTLYEIGAVEDSSVSVEGTSGPGDLTGNGNAASDPDGDGLYEDINGNDEFDIGDIQAFYSYLDTNAVQSATETLDFNGNDRVDVGDIQALFSEYRSG